MELGDLKLKEIPHVIVALVNINYLIHSQRYAARSPLKAGQANTSETWRGDISSLEVRDNFVITVSEVPLLFILPSFLLSAGKWIHLSPSTASKLDSKSLIERAATQRDFQS